MRPLPLPERSARRSTVRLPVICQSGAVLPSPSPLTGSLLETETILQVKAETVSDAETLTVTGTILWLGGQRLLGVADTLTMLGGVVSTTVTTVLAAAIP